MALPPKDPEHWLYRLSPDEWLRAARNELGASAEALQERAQRKGVANARRAAGMALNAVLVVQPNEAWGRSYMDHLRAVAHDAAIDEHIRHAALQLLDAPLDGPRFIRIGGGGDDGLAAAALAIIEWCEGKVGAV
jgi:hypothetical protein